VTHPSDLLRSARCARRIIGCLLTFAYHQGTHLFVLQICDMSASSLRGSKLFRINQYPVAAFRNSVSLSIPIFLAEV
jgi:hypothetical protein